MMEVFEFCRSCFDSVRSSGGWLNVVDDDSGEEGGVEVLECAGELEGGVIMVGDGTDVGKKVGEGVGLILISKKLIGSENYSSWRRSMTIALNAKNKLKIITKQYPEPDLNSQYRALWERNNDMTISWILNTVTDQISNNLRFVNSASALWLELQEHYSQLDEHRIYQLSNDIAQLKQSNCSVEVFYQKLKGYWDEIGALEAPYICTCNCICENGRLNGARESRKRLIQHVLYLIGF
ncbi:cysteine-rich receptor-like protein kinase 8 [Tanacetum coccineum]